MGPYRAASVVILQTGVLPRWLAWLGILVAIAMLFDVLYMNILPFLVWVVVASIVLLSPGDDQWLPRARRILGRARVRSTFT